MIRPLSECRLYAFVDTAYLHGRPPADLARQLCEGGADLIQLRAKGAPLDEVRRLAEAILPITRAAGAPLVINDHYALAEEVGADFCHLGQEDFFGAGHTQAAQLAGATGRAGSAGILPAEPEAPAGSWRSQRIPTPALVQRIGLGLSTHSQAQAERALAAQPDYLGVGPVYSTATKPEAQPISGDYLRWVSTHVHIPWFAIGGINLSNLDGLLAVGVRRICVVSAILNSPDVSGACREFQKRLARA